MLFGIATLILASTCYAVSAIPLGARDRSLIAQLREVVDDIRTSNASTIDSRLIQNTQMLGSNSSGILAQQQSLTAACSFSKSLIGESAYLDNSSSNYINASKENWYAMIQPPALRISFTVHCESAVLIRFRSQTCWLNARCIVPPQTAADVAVLFKVIHYMNIPYAIRGRGHNPNSGFGSIDSTGVLIDLSKLVRTGVSADHKSIKVGAESGWMDVYKALDPLGDSAVGTKEPVPGVVGSILGGIRLSLLIITSCHLTKQIARRKPILPKSIRFCLR